jgi:hypothetical protein
MRPRDTDIIRAACIKRQPKAKQRLREAVCFHDVLLVLALMPGRVLFEKRGTDVEMVIFDEVSASYSRGTWNLLSDDIARQSDDCVAFIANVIESHKAPSVRQPASAGALAALGA